MPCMDHTYPSHIDEAADREIKNLKKRNDMLARTACAALTALETHIGYDVGLDLDVIHGALSEQLEKAGLSKTHLKESLAWWKAHKDADTKEKQKEAAKAAKEKEQKRLVQTAKAKLSTQELQALTKALKAKGIF